MQENTSSSTPAKIAAPLYRLAVAAWWGGASLFTFVLTPTIFRAVNRDQAGAIVGYLFPGYFRWGLACGVIALISLALSKVRRKRLLASVLVAMLLITGGQAFVLEPKVAALKLEIPSFETTPADHPLRVKFRQLHAISAVANLTVIGGGLVLVLLI